MNVFRIVRRLKSIKSTLNALKSDFSDLLSICGTLVFRGIIKYNAKHNNTKWTNV